MRTRRLLVVLFAVTWVAGGSAAAYRYANDYYLYRGFVAPVTPGGIPRGRTETVSMWSQALRQHRKYTVYLPPGYARDAASGARYPVLYLLHAPPGRPDGYFLAGGMAVEANVLIARHRIPPMLLVIPDGKTSRFHSDTEWANARAGHFMGFVLDVVHAVDSHFATRTDRAYRAIAGLSEGGYGALNVALHNLDTFSAAESWSGYFDQTPTAAFSGASPEQLRANSPARYVPDLAGPISRLGFRAWMYQGKTDFTAPRRILQFSRELAAAGAEVHYGFFPGGHDWGLWRAQVPRMLLAVGHWFRAEPRAHRGELFRIGHPLPHAVLHAILFNPHRHCLIRHPPPGFRFPRYCTSYRHRLHRARALRRHGGRHHRAAVRSSAMTVVAGSPGRRWVALTFDADMTRGMLRRLRDGTQPTWYDRRITHELRATHTPATFFITGLWARAYPRVVRRLARTPLFEVENHSYDHAGWEPPCYGLPLVRGAAAKQREVTATAHELRALVGRAPTFFRYPGGCHSAADSRLVASLGERSVDWDVVSGDAFLRRPSDVEKQVLAAVRPGSIVVMHLVGAPNAPATAGALKRIIPLLRARRFRFVTVRRLLAPCLAHHARRTCVTEVAGSGQP